MLLLPFDARARPNAFESAVCDPDATDICTMTSSTAWTCDLGIVADGNLGGTITVVYDDTGTICETDSVAADYCAWGMDGRGSAFYCEVTNTSITAIRVIGTDPGMGTAGDTIWLQHDEDVYSYDLTDCGSGHVDGIVLAGSGDDEIVGSRSTSAYYTDKLQGDGGQDEIKGDAGDDELLGGDQSDLIWGDAGDDEIHGNSGGDGLWGGDGDDTIYGDEDADEVWAGAGNDTVYGGSGDDGVSGEDGDDTIMGGLGDDQLCGDDGTDNIDGQQGTDELWGDDVQDWKDGGPHPVNWGDGCDGNGYNSNCERTITVKPSGCPA